MYLIYEKDDSHAKTNFTYEIFILHVELKHFHISLVLLVEGNSCALVKFLLD